MKKKVGVVGYGGMGQWHVCSIAGTTYLNAIDFEKSDVCEIAGIYDIDPAKNEKARNDGYRVFDTLEDLLADKEIDIVVIATPNDVHESIAIAAMDAGKHVISEKPVTMSCEALENMIAASERNGKIFSVHQNRRYDDYFVGMKGVVESGEIGDIISLGNTEIQYYCFPKNAGDVVAKARLATEELYKLYQEAKKAKKAEKQERIV